MSIQKIAIIGPESTGKSSLCERLAEHYQSTWVPEYAREFLLERGTNYTYDDLVIIASGQLKKEESAVEELLKEPKNGKELKLFIDTEMTVMKVWSEFVFNNCHSWILNQAAHQQFDLYLLCNVDLPWIKDELREYPDLRTREILYKYYLDSMINQQTPWVDVSGGYKERLQKSIYAVDQLDKNKLV